MKKFFTAGLVAGLLMLLAACRAATTQETRVALPTEAMMDEPTETIVEQHAGMMTDEPAEAMPAGTPAQEAMMATPEWYGVSLVDAKTGQAFRISDFSGKVVLVETMAVWCSTCRRQQGEIQALHEQLGEQEDFVSVTLDIDPNENEADLKNFLEETGFDWRYAIAPLEVSREIGRLYGDQFLNPPSAPVLVIDRNGTAHPLSFGLKSAGDLLEAVSQYLGEM